jgi:hypothetical protein
VRETLERLGLDPRTETPGRKVVRVIGEALVHAMEMAKEAGNPEAAQVVAAECVVLAETKDHLNWELMSIAAQEATGPTASALKDAVEQVEEEEDEHLYHSTGWTRELWIESLGMKMEQPRQYMRSYVQTVKKSLSGQPIGSFFRPRPSAHPVPVYVAAVTVESAEVGGELGDGIMPFLPARSYLTQLVAAARSAAQRVGNTLNPLDCIVSIPTFIADDLEQARSAARYNLAFFAQLPFYRKQWRRCGFVDEVNALQEAWKRNDRRAAAALVSDRMVDEVCVFGPPSLCREQLAAFHEAGAALPVIAVSPVNEERLAATRKAPAGSSSATLPRKRRSRRERPRARL